VTSESGVVCQEVQQLLLRKRNTLTIYLAAHTLTKFYHFHAACSIADNTRKTDATLTLSGHHFVCTCFGGIVMQEWDHRLSHLYYMGCLTPLYLVN